MGAGHDLGRRSGGGQVPQGGAEQTHAVRRQRAFPELVNDAQRPAQSQGSGFIRYSQCYKEIAIIAVGHTRQGFGAGVQINSLQQLTTGSSLTSTPMELEPGVRLCRVGYRV